MKRSVLKAVSAVLASAMIFSLVCIPVSGNTDTIDNNTVSNDSFEMSVDSNNAALTVKNMLDGTVYSSLPDGEIKGINRAKAMSPIIISVINDKGEIEKINGFSEAEVKVKKQSNGYRVSFDFAERGITIPVLYELNDDGFSVHILSDEISDKDDILLDIALMPYFAAPNVNESGYIVVPDGSGAVIDFNSNNAAYTGLTTMWSVYGSDALENKSYFERALQSIKLPMFGVRFNGHDNIPAHGVMACIESGAALANFSVSAATVDCPYISAFFTFQYRAYTLATLLDRTSKAQKFYIASDNHTDTKRMTVHYRLLGENSTYSDMAGILSEIIYQDGDPVERDGASVFFDVYMSVYKQVYTLGIPHMSNYVLTTLDDCSKLVERFSDQNAVLLMRGLDKYGAVGGTVSTDFSIDSKIASRKKYLDFVKKTSQNGGSVYPECDFTRFTKGTFSYNSIFHSARSVTGKSLEAYYYNPATLLDSEKVVFKYLSVSKIDYVVRKYAKKAADKNILTAAPLSIGNSPYTDNKNGDRQDTVDMFRDSLQTVQKKKIDIMLENPDGYALNSTKIIIGMPTSSSGCNVFTYDIPFLQMVVGRYAVYGGTPINLSGDSKSAVLDYAETGSALTFAVSNGDYDEIVDTPLDFLYSADTDVSGDWIYNINKEYSARIAAVSDSYIVSHRTISDGVSESCFANGGRVVVNRTDREYEYNNTVIKPRDFAVFSDKEVA